MTAAWATPSNSARKSGFQGIEGPVPLDPAGGRSFSNTLDQSGLGWIAEVSTCTPAGLYVPLPGRSVEQHSESLEDGIVRSLEAHPASSTRWPATTRGASTTRSASTTASSGFRKNTASSSPSKPIAAAPTFNPWLTRDLLEALPDLRITCDFSHWCVVSERLVLDEFNDILALAARHAHHIQPRVGYSQGPQVPDPRAPEYADASRRPRTLVGRRLGLDGGQRLHETSP